MFTQFINSEKKGAAMNSGLERQGSPRSSGKSSHLFEGGGKKED